jgi:hypothetical protein
MASCPRTRTGTAAWSPRRHRRAGRRLLSCLRARPLPRIGRRSRVPPASPGLAHARSRSVAGRALRVRVGAPFDRRLGGFQDRRGFAGREAEYIAQHKCGALQRRQPLQRVDVHGDRWQFAVNRRRSRRVRGRHARRQVPEWHRILGHARSGSDAPGRLGRLARRVSTALRRGRDAALLHGLGARPSVMPSGLWPGGERAVGENHAVAKCR